MVVKSYLVELIELFVYFQPSQKVYLKQSITKLLPQKYRHKQKRFNMSRH